MVALPLRTIAGMMKRQRWMRTFRPRALAAPQRTRDRGGRRENHDGREGAPRGSYRTSRGRRDAIDAALAARDERERGGSVRGLHRRARLEARAHARPSRGCGLGCRQRRCLPQPSERRECAAVAPALSAYPRACVRVQSRCWVGISNQNRGLSEVRPTWFCLVRMMVS